MSKKGTPSYASKGMFDILAIEDDGALNEEESEEELNLPASIQPEPTSLASLSKGARKRLAKQAAKANEAASSSSQAVQAGVSSGTKQVPVTEQQVNGMVGKRQRSSQDGMESVKDAAASSSSALVDGAKEAIANGAAKVGESSATASDVASEIANSAEGVLTEISEQAVGAVPTVSDVTTTAEQIVNEVQQELSPVTIPPSSSFSPDLPDTLPHPKSDLLPANRKRKTPQDFRPAGPRADAPQSPSKIGVKFEDGIAPGEGVDGETIMIPTTGAVLAEKKSRDVVERTIWTFIMIGGFIGLLCLGHPYVILLVLVCQTLVYKEVSALFDLRDHGAKQLNAEGGDQWSKTLNWYFFVVTNYFLYGESIIYYFKHIVFVDAYFIPFAQNHRFISFMLYVVGFVGFVANLQRQYLRQQFALFCWVHISLLLIVVSSHFIVNNILEGLVWFFVPASLVICNDVMAYVCGKLFGRTPLIKLSPKKTVEGFVGAFICTVIFGLAWGTFFMRFPYMICPARDLGTTIFSNVTCRPNPVFVWREFSFTGPARQLLQAVLGRAPPTIPYAPFQLHVLVMATFASLFAPFGGFFASGFKRAFNIKDFGHSIPGHGGMTDRMDCQFMMGMFSYVYYSSLIRVQYITVGSVMQTVVTSLSPSEQLELLSDLRRFLTGQGIQIK